MTQCEKDNAHGTDVITSQVHYTMCPNPVSHPGYVYRLSMVIPWIIEHRVILYLSITMERRSVTESPNVGAMLGCRCDVSAYDLRRSMCRPSRIDDR